MKDTCIYCDKNSEKRKSLMVKIADMKVSELFLMRDQYYPGRCVVAFKDHCKELYEMSDEDRNDYFADVAKAAHIIKQKFNPDKINYGIFGDGMPHVHIHIVPKYTHLDRWGSNFELGPVLREASDEEITAAINSIREML